MRQLSLFDVAPAPDAAAPTWEDTVPASPSNGSNRHWTLVCQPSDPAVTLLAVLSVQWDDPKTGNATIFVPHTGKTFRGPDFLQDVFGPFHEEVATIARLHGIGEHRAATTNAWRGETRAVVLGPFKRQEGLRQAS